MSTRAQARGIGPQPASAKPPRAAQEEVLDEALEILAPTGLWSRGRGLNHAPMAAEALLHLGRPDAVLPWVADYRHHLEPAPPPGTVPDRERWHEALGERDRFPDWVAFFERELAGAPWDEVLVTWVLRLLPGVGSAAFHGVIRTAHAARALAAAPTPLRVGELARGLALWASWYHELPTRRAGAAGLRPAAALARLSPLVGRLGPRPASIDTALRSVAADPALARAIDLIDAGSDPAGTLAQVTTGFARVIVEQAHDWLGAASYVHTVTGPAAVGLLLPHLPPDRQAAAVERAWQVAAAIHVAFGATPEPPRIGSGRDPDDLIDRAVASGDEHAIKLTEASLRQHRDAPDDAYLLAAARVTAILGGA